MNDIITIKETTTLAPSAMAMLARAEIDQQIAAAHAYPRSIKGFRDEVLAMATLTESIADECTYALPRGGKTIEGPSVRFAEIVTSAWGNSRVGARVTHEDDKSITAQGVFHDLQKNVAIAYEVRRRITDKNGKRYNDDMITVAGNAAAAIAFRNAVFKCIPAAFWRDLWEEVRRVSKGDIKTLANRRADAFKAFQGYGVTADQIFSHLEVKGEEDINLEHLAVLRGFIVSFKEGTTTPEEIFSPKKPVLQTGKTPKTLDDLIEKQKPKVEETLHNPETGEIEDKVPDHQPIDYADVKG